MGFKEAHGLCRFKESGSDLLHEQPAADFIFHKSTTKGKWMVFLSLNLPPTLFSQVLRDELNAFTKLPCPSVGTMVLSPERGPHFMLALIFIRQCLDACKANLGDRKFPTADQPNFVGLEIIYIYVYVFE